MRVAFFCMPSVFSAKALEGVLAAGHEVVAVVQPQGGAQARRAPVLTRERGLRRRLRRRLLAHLTDDGQQAPTAIDPFAIAERERLPRYQVGDASAPPGLALLERERVDAVVIAFFNQLLRPALLERLPLGAINAHPSRLPHLRGPSPLFWTFHRAEDISGVSVHQVTPGEDDGPLFGQTEIAISAGMTGEALLATMAEQAPALLVDGLSQLAAGEPGVPQADVDAVRAPRPTDADRQLRCLWPAERVFRFVRGVGRWTALVVEADGRLFRAVDARGYDDTRRPPGDWALLGDTLMLACDDGSVDLCVVPLTA